MRTPNARGSQGLIVERRQSFREAGSTGEDQLASHARARLQSSHRFVVGVSRVKWINNRFEHAPKKSKFSAMKGGFFLCLSLPILIFILAMAASETPDSKVGFPEPTLWGQYKWYILAALSLGALEAAFISALNRRSLRRARDELHASEERMNLAAIAANLRFWVWEVSPNEVWVSKTNWDRAWSPSQPVKFEQFIATVHAGDRDSMRRAIQNALEGNGEYRAEYRMVLPDSTIRWIAGRGRVERDHDGKPIRLRAVSIDISERRRAEEVARDLSARLINAQEEERARLAHALHDDVTQRLAVLAIDAGRRGRSLRDATDREAMRAIHDGLVRASEDIHALCYALHPAILEDLGLIEALMVECDRFSDLESIRVQFKAEQNLDGPARPTALCLFRIAQEALRNVARHAKASSVEVTLSPVDDGLLLVVQDNGTGFDPACQRTRPSLGHASMRQRITFLDGELDIESLPGHGTAIRAWVPLKTEEHRETSTIVVG